MAVHVLQDENNPDVVVMKFVGNWTVAEYEEANRQIFKLANESDHKIYQISDFLESGSIPPNVLSLAARATRALPDNIALIVAVNSSRLVTSLIDVAAKLNRELGKKTVAARSLEDAYKEVERRRNSTVR